MEPAPPSLDDCLKLLRGERDEQKLAGLLLAAKFCQGNNKDSIPRVYDAVGVQFLNRLLMTGMGEGTPTVNTGDDRAVYLRLAVTVLAAFCRVPEIASSSEMVSKVPIVSEIISKSLDPSIFEECYEFLLLVAAASENGITSFFEPGVMKMLAPHISSLHDGSRSLEHAMRLMQLIMNKKPLDTIDTKYLSVLACMVASIARQFAVLHNALKFDALHLLTTLLSSNSTALHEALRSMPSETWASYVRIGISEILQNRVVSSEKLQALLLADSLMSILGENWLLDQNKVHDLPESMPVDKYLLLVLESSRVEVAVLLNEIAYLKYEASKFSSTTGETILLKQRNLAVSFSLIEKIIKLISNVCDAEGCPINESTSMKVISGLSETINLVLEFLQDSKDNGQKRGDDLLAAVRITGSTKILRGGSYILGFVVGCYSYLFTAALRHQDSSILRYLAEAPYACKETSQDLLEYMLSIEGEDEPRPFSSICFLLPMLCQITTGIDGCMALASFGGHKAVAECIVKMIRQNDAMVEDSGTIYLACDTILNVLLNRKELQAHLEGPQFVNLLQAFALWSVSNDDLSMIMMASSICTLVFDLTSEEALLKDYNLDHGTLQSLAQLILRSLNESRGNIRGLLSGCMSLKCVTIKGEDIEHSDLRQIISAGYKQWADQFPIVSNIVFHGLGRGRDLCTTHFG